MKFILRNAYPSTGLCFERQQAVNMHNDAIRLSWWPAVSPVVMCYFGS